MGKIGWQQLLIILILALVIFGGGKLAGVGKALGTSVKDFKNEMADIKTDEPATTTAEVVEEKEESTKE